MITLSNTKEINSVDIKGFKVIIEEIENEYSTKYSVSLKYPKGHAIIEDVQEFQTLGEAYKKAFNLVTLVVNWKVKL
jgi:hypothetical protein